MNVLIGLYWACAKHYIRILWLIKKPTRLNVKLNIITIEP